MPANQEPVFRRAVFLRAMKQSVEGIKGAWRSVQTSLLQCFSPASGVFVVDSVPLHCQPPRAGSIRQKVGQGTGSKVDHATRQKNDKIEICSKTSENLIIEKASVELAPS